MTLRETLRAVADCLQLTLSTSEHGDVYGSGEKTIQVFDTKKSLKVLITDSLVDERRGIVVTLTQIVGDLYVLLITDDQAMQFQLFTLDRAKFGVPMFKFLPQFWNREQLYKLIASGVKSYFKKDFHRGVWEKYSGKEMLETYFKRKEASRKSAIVTGM